MPNQAASVKKIRNGTQIHAAFSTNKTEPSACFRTGPGSGPRFRAGPVRRAAVPVPPWRARQEHASAPCPRPYLDAPQQLSIVDNDWHRSIQLTSRGSRTAVIWNPWIERAEQFDDMADDGWQRMLCIETANVMDDVVTLEPGAKAIPWVSVLRANA